MQLLGEVISSSKQKLCFLRVQGEMQPPLTGLKSEPGHERHTCLLIMFSGTRNSLLYLVLTRGRRRRQTVCGSKLWTNIAAY